MAGTGKTTIAFTFSQILDKIQTLGASFFCSHLDTESSNAELIFPTLAYELARHSTAASNALLHALKEDRNVGYKSVRDQFFNLIVTPAKVASEGVPHTDHSSSSLMLWMNAPIKAMLATCWRLSANILPIYHY